MSTDATSQPLLNLSYIAFRYSDGSSNYWPQTNKVIKKNAAGRAVRYTRLAADDERVLHWRSFIGDAIASDQGYPNPLHYAIKDFPNGYALFLKVTGPQGEPYRTDTCLFGGPTVPMYRSPNEFKSHALWLFKGGMRGCDCGCFHRRYEGVSREVRLLSDEVPQVVNDTLEPRTIFEARNIGIRTPLATAIFGAGDVVWVVLKKPWTRSDAIIESWPGVVVSQGLQRYSVRLLPSPKEHWFLEENIVPWASIPDIDKVKHSVNDLQIPHRSILSLIDPALTDCSWSIRVGALLAAYKAAESIAEHTCHFDIPYEDRPPQTGVYLGAERIVPGHIVRLRVNRTDLSSYAEFRSTSDNAYALLKQHERTHRESNEGLYLFVENIDVIESSMTYNVIGQLVELVKEYGDISDETLLEEAIPPKGYRFHKFQGSGRAVAVSVHLVDGRYYPHMTEHYFFAKETVEPSRHLAVLEGLYPSGDSGFSAVHKCHGMNRSEAITSALRRYI